MARRCTVCAHPQLAEIERLLDDSGTKLSDLSSRFGLHRKSLERHRDVHVPQRLTRAVGQAALVKTGIIAGVVEAGREQLDDLSRFAIVRKAERLGRINERWLLLQEICQQRVEAYFRYLEEKDDDGQPLHKPVPGADTGLLYRTFKTVAGRAVEEWKLDTALLAEERALQDQASRETGQLQEMNRGEGDRGSEGKGAIIYVPIPSSDVPPPLILDTPGRKKTTPDPPDSLF